MTVLQEKEYNQKWDWQLFARLAKFVRPYKKEIIFIIILMFLVAGVDTAFPLMTKYAIDKFVVTGQRENMHLFIMTFIFLVIIQAVNVYIFIVLAGKFDMYVCYDIRKKGFQKLQELSFSYYDKTSVGWLMARIISDIRKLGDILAWGLVDIVWSFCFILFISIVMLILNWKLALMVMTVVPALVFVSMVFQKKILKSYREVRRINSQITSDFNEGISGAKTTKTLAREKENLKEFQMDTSKMYKSSVRAAVFSSIYLPIVITLGSIGTGLVLWYGGVGVQTDVISYGTLVAFLSYTIQFFEPVRPLARVIAEFQSARASAERVVSLIETKSEICDGSKVTEKFGTFYDPKIENWPEIKGEIIFKDVSFSYVENEDVLIDFNLKVRAGEKIALIGSTGCGKSTIVNLACRFYEPDKGEILVDGINYREISQMCIHSNLGYVLQTPHLFSGTIRDNIAYGNNEASIDKVIAAAKLVNAHGFIMDMSDGYESEVGEGGGRLSIGQKQLISFARAILADPKIFVLDEATSSIDTETEMIIQNAIAKLLEGRTSFIIAHRLSTIRNADRILVLKDGKIIEEGNHFTLLDRKGHYYNLYMKQFMNESENDVLNVVS